MAAEERRGNHGALPHANTKSRPASWSSSASWQPDWPLPTIRESPRGQGSWIAVVLQVDLEEQPGWQRVGTGRAMGAPGNAPVARTTRPAWMSPADVRAMNRPGGDASINRPDLDALAEPARRNRDA